MNSKEDLRRVRRIKHRDQRALEQLVIQYGYAVKCVIGRVLEHFPEEVEECMDDVFLEVWDHINQFDAKKGTLKNWILSIARYRSINHLRKLSRRFAEESLEQSENHPELTTSIDVTGEANAQFEELLVGLSETDQQILRSRYREEMDISEIASEMQMKESTVYSRLSRSRKQIRKKLESKR